MKKTNRLSHSAATRFMDCAKSYEYHYIERLRPVKQSAALLFGSAVDYAFGAMLSPKDKTPEDIFSYFWRFQDVNGKNTFLTTCTEIVYSNSDFDMDLVSDSDIVKILEFNDIKEEHTRDSFISLVDELYKRKDYFGFDHISLADKKLLNMVNWYSLHKKGLLMVDALRTKIMPKIKKVHGVQEAIKLENTDGDSVIGFVDLIVDWEDKGLVVLDLKTSTRRYDKDSVLVSPQLSLYVHALSDKFKTRQAGYIVLYKQVNKNKTKICSICGNDGSGKRHQTCDAEIDGKRCNGKWNEKINPEIQVEVIINEIPERTEEIVLQNIDMVNESIKTSTFPRNFGSCIKFGGAVICPYWDLCYHGKTDSLVVLEPKKDENSSR